MEGTAGLPRRRSHWLAGVAAIALAMPATRPALAQEAKWQPWLEAGGAIGTDHSFGDVDMFIPVWQDQTSLLFGDLRGTFSSEPTQEGNFGLGYRTQVDPEWILGGYGYLDIQNSKNDNLFYQATLGLEALSVDWDFRLNGYIPINAGGQDTSSGGKLQINGNTIGITGTDKEKPLYGFDGEVGWRLPVFPADGDVDVRAFIGGYYFANSDVDTIAGPRGRLEVRLYDLDILGTQSRLTLDAEVQWDEPRGTQAFGGLELRIPLGVVTGTPGPKLSPLDRRMVDRVQRDVDIVTEKYQPDSLHDVVVDELTGKTHTIVFASADGSSTAPGTRGNPVSLDAAVARAEALGPNAIIVVEGNGGPITVSQPLQLASGQALLGGGSLVPLHDAGNSNVTVGFAVPGAPATLSGTDAGRNLIEMATGTENEVFGITLDGAMSNGIAGLDMERAIVKQTAIEAPSFNGIYLRETAAGSAFIHLESNSVVGAGEDGILVANRIDAGIAHSQTVLIEDNQVTSAGANGIEIDNRASGAGASLWQSLAIVGNGVTSVGGALVAYRQSGIRVGNAIYDGGAVTQAATIAGNVVALASSAGIDVETVATSGGTLQQSLAVLANSIAGASSVGIVVNTLVSGAGGALTQSLDIAGNTVSGIGNSLQGGFTGKAIGISVGTTLYALGSAAQSVGVTIAGNTVANIGGGDRAYGIRVAAILYGASASQAVLVSGNQVAGVSAFNLASGIDIGNYVDSAGSGLLQSLAILSNNVSDVSAVISPSVSDTPLLGVRAFGIVVTNNDYGGSSLSQALSLAGNTVVGIGSDVSAIGIGVGDNLSESGTVLTQSVAMLDNRVSEVSATLTAVGIAFSDQTYYLASIAPQHVTLAGNEVGAVSAGNVAAGIAAVLGTTSLAARIDQYLTISANVVSGVGATASAAGILVANNAYQAAISQVLDLSGNSVSDVAGDVSSSLGGIGILLFNSASHATISQQLNVSGNSLAGLTGDALQLQDLVSYGLVAQSGAIVANQASGNGGAGLALLTAASGGAGSTASVSLAVTGNLFSYDAAGVSALAAAVPGAGVTLDAVFDGNRIDGNAGDGIQVSAAGAGAAVSFGLGPSDSVRFNSGFGIELSTAGGGIVQFATDGATITGNSLGNLVGP